MAENKHKITNKKQFELLVGILEENPAVAKGLRYAESAGFGRDLFSDVWSEITATLNSAGPPTRKTPEWQKVWNDLKSKVKNKLQHNQTEVKATGGGPNRLIVLSTYEEAVVNLLSLEKTTDHAGTSFGLNSQPSPGQLPTISQPTPRQLPTISQPSPRQLPTISQPSPRQLQTISQRSPRQLPTMSQPFPRQLPPISQPSPRQLPTNTSSDSSDSSDENLEPNRDEPVEVPPARTPATPRRPTPRNYRMKLLEVQTDYIRELSENSREILQIQKENLQLQKEKLTLKREHHTRMEKQRADELQFQMHVLEYKKMKLELQRSNAER